MHNANNPNHRNPDDTSRTAPGGVPAERKPASPSDAPSEQPKKEAVAPTVTPSANPSRDDRR
ncbi:hypothetical protein ACFJIW_18795 [Tahibacter sp. UC22_41]|uniref:hypothetical protein n=1 Tax=Tahibacter sp. UC22_41 TaxID=3350178 RepID=UPI0036D8472E